MSVIFSCSKPLGFICFLCCLSAGFAQVKIGELPQEIHENSLLELESSDKVLVITRLSTAQMNSIQPLPGAVVFNTDTQCLYFFQVDSWINLCTALNLNFETLGIVNNTPTIAITKSNDTLNFEVLLGSINSNHITDFSIASQDIQNNAITDEKLAPNSVGTEELQDNTITDFEINYDEVTLADFKNDAGYLNSDQLVSTNTGNAIINGTDFGVYLSSDLLTHFDGNWNSLLGVPINLDTDSTDDFNGQWSSLSGIPPGFADNTDDNTTYTAGNGLVLTGTAFSINNAQLAPDWTNLTNVPSNLDMDSTDDFDGTWSSLSGIPTGFADNTDDNTTYTAGNGLVLTGTAFSINNAQLAPDWVNLTNVPSNLDLDSTDDFDGNWSSLLGIPINLDTDSTDDFDGTWSSLFGIPPGFADNTDDNTTYTAGNGLVLTGTAFSINNAQLAPDWANLTNVPSNLDLDSTDDFDGNWSSLLGIPFNLDTDSTDDFDGQWSNLLGIPINLDTDSTDDFDGTWSSLFGIPAGFTDGIDDNTQLDEAAVDAFVSNNGYLISELDGDPTNELQDISQVLQSGNDAGGSTISNLADPVAGQDAATKAYVDAVTLTATPGSILFGANSGAPQEDNGQLFWDDLNNRLGIGLATRPLQNKLTVAGTTRTSGLLNSDGTVGTPAYRFSNNGNTGMFLIHTSGILGFTTNAVEALRIDAGQNVGIGQENPIEKLHVGGNIRSDGNFISNTPNIQVPDYVFQSYFNGASVLKPEYRLPALAEVEAFIKAYHHLPGIASNQEVKAQGGLVLNKTALLNLEKIEELFIYTLEQQTQIDALKSENERLSKDLKELNWRIEKMEELILAEKN